MAGSLDLARLVAASDDEVRREPLALRGIGRWTADVDLLFALSRPDAWPSGDLALAKAVQELWGLPAQPGWDELDAWAERWPPLRAVAARFGVVLRVASVRAPGHRCVARGSSPSSALAGRAVEG